MLLVELRDDAGNKLQPASGQTATLTWVIPASLEAAAPVSLPLWYFSDSSGRWIQQGAAVRAGNYYIGRVSHFTYWSCGGPYATVNFKLRVKDQFHNPVAYARTVLVSMRDRLYRM